MLRRRENDGDEMRRLSGRLVMFEDGVPAMSLVSLVFEDVIYGYLVVRSGSPPIPIESHKPT